MKNRKIYRGDDGSTGLLGEGRVSKFDLRIETLGTLDEASAALGLARALSPTSRVKTLIQEVQRDLHTLMAEAATTPGNTGRFGTLERKRLDWLEQQAAQLEAEVQSPSGFILPGDSLPGAAFSLARTIIRRAERRVAELASHEEVNSEVMLPYLNRLSLLCFHLELAGNREAGKETSLARDKKSSPGG